MKYISTPLEFNEEGTRILREIDDRIKVLDNLVELIVFTPRGSFEADPDFGFEYWNHEYSNVHYREFNNSQTGRGARGIQNEVAKKECEDSIKNSLASYEPLLKNVSVSIELDTAADKQLRRRNTNSKYEVDVIVEGNLDDGLGTKFPYRKEVTFLIEPTVKRYR
jgi:hypothetical protein